MAADLTDLALPPIIGSIGSMTVALLGLPPLPLFVAFCAASVGMLLANRLPRWKAMLAFPFVWILAAEGGVAFAQWRFPDHPSMQLFAVGVLGLFFQPLFDLVVNLIKARRVAPQKETQ